jgi:pre-mRNA-processing factor 19
MQAAPTGWHFIQAAKFLRLLVLIRASYSMICRVVRLSHRFTQIQVCTTFYIANEPRLIIYVGLNVAAFHPDGHLFAAGGADGQIKLFHVKTGESAANFELGGPVQDTSFSENGIWFAAVAKGSTSIVIFDLRKEGKAAEAKVLEIGGQVDSIRWDYTGQYLAASGPRGLTISQYTKSSKSWSDVISTAVPATAVEWGPHAKSLITINPDGVVTVLA